MNLRLSPWKSCEGIAGMARGGRAAAAMGVVALALTGTLSFAYREEIVFSWRLRSVRGDPAALDEFLRTSGELVTWARLRPWIEGSTLREAGFFAVEGRVMSSSRLQGLRRP